MEQISMKLKKNFPYVLIKMPISGICLILFCFIISSCTQAPSIVAQVPAIDLTALSAQIAQTLEAKYTQQAPKIPTPIPGATLLPTAIANTLAPTPFIATSQPATILVPSSVPSLANSLPVNTPIAGAAVPPVLFAVIHVITNVNHADISTSCPPGYDFQFTGSISTNGPGTVIYNWEFSDNSKTNNQTLTFKSAETQTISTDWNLGTGGKTPGSNPYKGWARVTIVQPNNQVFTRTSFNFECK
jgi:hypothetical protein